MSPEVESLPVGIARSLISDLRRRQWYAVREALRAQPERSDRSIAHELQVHRGLVACLREHMTRSGEIPHKPKRLGRDRKMYRVSRCPV